MPSLCLQLYESGALALDLAAVGGVYGVEEGSMIGFGEAELETVYADSIQKSGADLTHRRHKNRVVDFRLNVSEVSVTDAVDARENAKNLVGALIEKARQYALRDRLGTTVEEHEIVLKYRPHNGNTALYARVIDGRLAGSQYDHTAFSLGSSTTAYAVAVPVTLVIEPYWRTERDVYLRNVLLNPGFEAGGSGAVGSFQPYGWTRTVDGGITGATNENTATTRGFLRTGARSHQIAITASTGSGRALQGQEVAMTGTGNGCGYLAGQTVRATARAWLVSKGGTGRAVLRLYVKNGAAAVILEKFAYLSTVGTDFEALTIVADLPTAAATIGVEIQAQAQAASDTARVIFDDVILDNHADNLLLTCDFESDTDSNGVADNWTAVTEGTASAVTGLTATSKYETYAHTVGVGSGTGSYRIEQSVTLVDFRVRAGDVLTAGVWAKVSARAGTARAYLQLVYKNADGDALLSNTTSDFTSTDWTWAGVSLAVPQGATIATVRLYADTNGSAQALTILYDWATLYRSHHDGSGGRWWPFDDEWLDSSRLTDDPEAVDGRQVALMHSGFRGNVPSPAQILYGAYQSPPIPIVVGYKRNRVEAVPYADSAAATNVAGLASQAHADYVGGAALRWTPANTTATELLRWTGSDAPPGRYLIAVAAYAGANSTKFRLRARVAANGGFNSAGGMTPYSAPLTITVGGSTYYWWPLGVLQLPPQARLPRYSNDFRLDLYGRCTDTTGSPTIDIDGVWFIPIDGYYQGSPASAVTLDIVGDRNNYVALLLDAITPTPGGLLHFASNSYRLTLDRLAMSGIYDVLIAQEEPIYVGERGKFVFTRTLATYTDRDFTSHVGLYYRPLYTSPAAL